MKTEEVTEYGMPTKSGWYISVISSPALKMVGRLLVSRRPWPINHSNLFSPFAIIFKLVIA